MSMDDEFYPLIDLCHLKQPVTLCDTQLRPLVLPPVIPCHFSNTPATRSGGACFWDWPSAPGCTSKAEIGHTKPLRLPRASRRPRPTRGEHLSYTLGCRHCHGADLGGTVFTDAPPFHMTAPNPTRGDGGIGAGYTAADWA